ncbi:MAG: FixH family protein [Alphaproteobacteria bacterium]
MENTPETIHPGDKWIPWYFVIFFAVIAVVDFTFVTVAIKTQTGVVTQKAYEKGLAYDTILGAAETQKSLGFQDKILFEKGKISWAIVHKDGAPLTGAVVTARFYRPAHEGHDFEASLVDRGHGAYEISPNFPLKGAWTARLEAQWQDQQHKSARYAKSFDLIIP